MKKFKHITIFTDGACRGNPGPGGWGVLMLYNEHSKKLSGAEPDTTNNRMELTAAIKALSALKEPCDIDLTTDSQYLRNGVTVWMEQWKNRNWKTAGKKPVKNLDLWKQLDKLIQHHHQINWHWVEGHSGHHENEIVDKLATEAIDNYLTK